MVPEVEPTPVVEVVAEPLPSVDARAVGDTENSRIWVQLALQGRGLTGRRGSRNGKLALSVALLYGRRRGVGAVLVDPLDGGRGSWVLNLELRLSRLHTEVMH